MVHLSEGLQKQPANNTDPIQATYERTLAHSGSVVDDKGGDIFIVRHSCFEKFGRGEISKALAICTCGDCVTYEKIFDWHWSNSLVILNDLSD